MLSSPLSHLPSLQPAIGFLRSFKKSISLVQSVAFSRPARNRPHSQNRAQKPFSDTPYSLRKTGFLRAPLQWNPHIPRNLIGKILGAQKKPTRATRRVSTASLHHCNSVIRRPKAEDRRPSRRNAPFSESVGEMPTNVEISRIDNQKAVRDPVARTLSAVPSRLGTWNY